MSIKETKTHELKTWPLYFEAILSGEKTFEYRANDRGFNVGDILFLREWEPSTQEYTGRSTMVRVTYLLLVYGYGFDKSQKEEYAVMSFLPHYINEYQEDHAGIADKCLRLLPYCHLHQSEVPDGTCPVAECVKEIVDGRISFKDGAGYSGGR